MRRVYILSILLSISTVLISCNSKAQYQTSSNSNDSLSISIKSLIQVAPKIDSDDTSYWGYESADSLLNSNTNDVSLKTINQYNALTHVFFGMSYTRSLKFGIEGLTKCSDCLNNKKALSDPMQSEINAINSYILFYEMSEMSSAPQMRNTYNEYLTLYNNNSSSSDCTRYQIINNKKLFFKTFAYMLVDLSIMQNDKTSISKNINQWAAVLDEIQSDSPEDLNKLTQEQFDDYLNIATRVEYEMINKLSFYIGKIE